MAERSEAEQKSKASRFKQGQTVVIQSDFHNRYFRNVSGKLKAIREDAATDDIVWELELDIQPSRAFIPEQYLLTEAEAATYVGTRLTESAETNDAAPKKVEEKKPKAAAAATDKTESGNGKTSLWSKIIPWRK